MQNLGLGAYHPLACWLWQIVIIDIIIVIFLLYRCVFVTVSDGMEYNNKVQVMVRYLSSGV